MKKITLLLFVLFCAAPAFAQVTFVPSNVWFPHIDIGGDPNGLNYVTLVQVSNNTSSPTIGTLVVYSDTGTQQSVSFNGAAPATSLVFTLQSGQTQQIPVTLSGAITDGWLQITYTPAPAATNVILQYLSGSTVLTEVGIDPFYGQQISSTYFPVETGANLNAGIAIANPNGPAAVLLQLTDPNTGNMIASTTLSLPENGHTAALLTNLFSTVSGITQIRSVLTLTSCATTACTTAGPGFIATALRLNTSSNSFTSLPVIQGSSGGSALRVLPHVLFGGSPSGVNFQTILYLTTFSGFTSTGTPASSSLVTGQASIFDDNGNPIAPSANGGAPASSFTFTVLSNRVTKIVLSGGNNLQAGWIELNLPSASTPLVINAVFQTYQGSTLTSEASVLEGVQDIEGMIYIGLQPGVTDIGVALANPLDALNSITLTLYNSAGFVLATQTFTLAPYGHLAQYIDGIFPQLQGTNFSGTLSIQSTSNFSAIALRQNGTNAPGGVPGFAVLTVTDSVMYVPSIINLQITSTNRTTGQVNFSISVNDYSSSLVTPTATGVFAEAAIIYASTSVSPDDYTFYLDGSSMSNATSGTLSSTFQSAHTNIPSGTAATFEIYITDAAGNYSNVVSLPFKF